MQLQCQNLMQEKREALERLQRMEYFESQDFDPVENDVERAAELARDQADYASEEAWRWLLSGVRHVQMWTPACPACKPAAVWHAPWSRRQLLNGAPRSC